MTNTKLVLPFQSTRGSALKVLFPLMLASAFFVPLFLAYGVPLILRADEASAEVFTILRYAAIFLFFFNIGISFLFLFSIKPAVIDISRAGILVTPLPILGFSYGKQASYNLSDFTSVGLKKIQTRSGYSYFVELNGENKIRLDIPTDMTAKEFSEQLASTLGLKSNFDI